VVNGDCKGNFCFNQVCQPTCADGTMNGTETDVDCGGTCDLQNLRCASGKRCLGNNDCSSLVCNLGICAAPSCSDGVQNGNETDVDCGGACDLQNLRCSNSAHCLVGNDCTSAACSAGGICVVFIQGATCAASSQCATGHCVSGYCCDTSCTTSCQACSSALTGALSGTCHQEISGMPNVNGTGSCP
jgi:hypothetical protein